jgi:hypothetical protein
MQLINGHRRSVPRANQLTLLARLVGRDGESLRPTDVRSIEYWIVYERTSVQAQTPVQHAIPIDVGQVIRTGLSTESEWLVDRVGYNFCHNVSCLTIACISTSGANIELHYRLTLITGETVIASFRIRNAHHD